MKPRGTVVSKNSKSLFWVRDPSDIPS